MRRAIIRPARNLIASRSSRDAQCSPKRTRVPLPTGPNQSWSKDSVSDGLAYGRRFRCLGVDPVIPDTASH
ncbi:hypothetical protein C5O79_01185 [Burkholderia sp. SRS-25]|nr:hypothetical protein DF036_34415 [Burkholderia contaminans]TCW73456.1 hypothetical protein C5O79_01185 [Burkholderia sp. SRS-25]